MTATGPYLKAVSNFMKIASAIAVPTGKSSRQLASETGVPIATAYRMIGTMERQGFIRRDEGAAPCVGPRMLRTYCSAWGFGSYSIAMPSVLDELRRQTQLTAFSAFCVGNKITIAAVSFGMGPGYVEPRSFGELGAPPAGDDPSPINLHWSSENVGRTSDCHVVLGQAAESESAALVVGVLSNTAAVQILKYAVAPVALAAKRITASAER